MFFQVHHTKLLLTSLGFHWYLGKTSVSFWPGILGLSAPPFSLHFPANTYWVSGIFCHSLHYSKASCCLSDKGISFWWPLDFHSGHIKTYLVLIRVHSEEPNETCSNPTVLSHAFAVSPVTLPWISTSDGTWLTRSYSILLPYLWLHSFFSWMCLVVFSPRGPGTAL